jgi:probable F420-dependent oxidoreductase
MLRLGANIRLMGPQARPEIVTACARAAEAAGLDDLWVPDHLAIPPDDAEGSNGIYLDALASLAYLAACTEHIGLGTAALVLPYRPALPTAKLVASVQELSAGRLQLGVGVGWMDAEFRALGVDRGARGRITDETLAFLNACFSAPDDVVVANGQPFLFRPRPPRPPIFIGGAARFAHPRVLEHGDGWMPIGLEPEALAPEVERLRADAAAVGRPAPEVVWLGAISLRDPAAAADRIAALAEAGATRVVWARRYADADEFQQGVEAFARAARRGLA